MYPTPSSAGATSSASSAFGSTGMAVLSSPGIRYTSEIRILTAAPTAMPRKIHALPLAAPSDSCTVARSTSAQAVPSG